MVADKEYLIERFFQISDTYRYRWLRYVKFAGGFDNTVLFNHGHKVLQLFQGEVHHGFAYNAKLFRLAV